MRIKIGDKEIKADVAKTRDELKKGLLGTDSLPKGEGLLLQFEDEGDYPITMKGMKYPLTLIFSKGGKINRVLRAEPEEDNIKGFGPIDAVLEINPKDASGIKPGQDMEIIGEKKTDGTVEMTDGGLTPKGAAHVLDENGNVQMNIKGGERIFSRKATSRMFELAKKGDYKKLAKFVFDELDNQDSRPEEYAKN